MSCETILFCWLAKSWEIAYSFFSNWPFAKPGESIFGHENEDPFEYLILDLETVRLPRGSKISKKCHKPNMAASKMFSSLLQLSLSETRIVVQGDGLDALKDSSTQYTARPLSLTPGCDYASELWMKTKATR